MNRSKERLRVRLVGGAVAACLTLAASSPSLDAQSFPRYDHVFLLIMENENSRQVIGDQHAPILNALAQDYGLATNYRGVADRANRITSPCSGATSSASTATTRTGFRGTRSTPTI